MCDSKSFDKSVYSNEEMKRQHPSALLLRRKQVQQILSFITEIHINRSRKRYKYRLLPPEHAVMYGNLMRKIPAGGFVYVALQAGTFQVLEARTLILYRIVDLRVVSFFYGH